MVGGASDFLPHYVSLRSAVQEQNWGPLLARNHVAGRARGLDLCEPESIKHARRRVRGLVCLRA